MREHHDTDEEFYEEVDFQTLMSTLHIFERTDIHEEIPPGFNAVTLIIDGGIHSNLHWEEARTQARLDIHRGYKILFDLRLGLFNELTLPISSQTQFQALSLSIDQFQEQIVPEFQEHIVGVILLRTNLLFQKEVPYDSELEFQFDVWTQEQKVAKNDHFKALFYRDIVIDYLELLAHRLGENSAPFILVNASEITSPLLFAQLTAQDCFARLHLAIHQPFFARKATIWKEGKDSCGYIGRGTPKILPQQIPPPLGLLLPSYDIIDPTEYEGLEEAMEFLLKKEIPFTVISEEFLTTEWSGLDRLLVSQKAISPQRQRLLAGFEAAGGEVIFVPGGNCKLGKQQDFERFLEVRID